MKTLGILLLGVALSPLLVNGATAQCVVVDPAMVPDVSVDPLDATGPNEIVQPATLRFRRVGIENTPLSVTYQIVDEDSSGTMRVGMYAGPAIEWRSNDASRDIGVLRQEAYAPLRSGTFSFQSGETSKSVDIRLFVKDLQADLPAGLYREQYSIRYWCGDPNVEVANELPGIVSVAIRVPNVLSANVAGASNRGVIDFLDFSTPSRSLGISVRSTGPYRVTARSANGGVMLRDGATGSNEIDRIVYAMRFGGQPLTLGASVDYSYPRAGLRGLQTPLDVRVEDVAGKRAGKYGDTVTLTLAPAG